MNQAVEVSNPEMTFRTASGATIQLQDALNKRLIALGQDVGKVWINGSQVDIDICLEAQTINAAAAEYLKQPELVKQNIRFE
jgi:hypothetical protein